MNNQTLNECFKFFKCFDSIYNNILYNLKTQNESMEYYHSHHPPDEYIGRCQSSGEPMGFNRSKRLPESGGKGRARRLQQYEERKLSEKNDKIPGQVERKDRIPENEEPEFSFVRVTEVKQLNFYSQGSP